MNQRWTLGQAWKQGIATLLATAFVGGSCLLLTGCGESEEPLPDADVTQVAPSPTSTLTSASQSQPQAQPSPPARPQPVLAPSVNQSDAVPVNTLAPRTQAVSGDLVSKPAVASSSHASASSSNTATLTPAGHYGGFHAKLSRSPWPLEGEKFGKPIAPTLLVDAQTLADLDAIGSLQARPGQIIPWDQARRYVGQTITVQGKIVLANRT
ncbi:MAG: hypothetical protein ACF8OB_06835, partial [Phycisphaeraceae bacterium JB051]